MGTKNAWIAGQTARAKIVTVTVGSNTNGHTFILTTGTGKSISHTAASDTVTTIAASLVAKAAVMQQTEGDWAELTFSENTAGVFTVTGPADGAPFTFTASGTGTMSASETTAPLSPHDANDAANWSRAAVPVDTDDLVWEGHDRSMLYNLSALAAVVPDSAKRYTTFTGRIGLPDTAAGGYKEFRAVEFSLKCAAVTWEQSSSDGAQQFRLLLIDPSGAITLNIIGDGTVPALFEETLEVRGAPASSVLNGTGGSVSVSPASGQACIFATVLATNCTVRIGPGATLSGTVNMRDCTSLVKASWSTSFTISGQTSVEVGGAAAGVIVIDSGTMTWKSTGAIGASPKIGSGGTLDVSQAPAAITPSGTVQLYAGATLNDAAGRYGNWAAKLNRCRLDEVNLILPDDKTITLS